MSERQYMTGVLKAFAPLAGLGRRHRVEHTANGTLYGPWRIYFDPPPIPTRECDWHYVHEDFDGAPDANDNRCGSCTSFTQALKECDEMDRAALAKARGDQ